MLRWLENEIARLAIAAEVDPDGFASGVQHHWAAVCEHLEKCADKAGE